MRRFISARCAWARRPDAEQVPKVCCTTLRNGGMFLVPLIVLTWALLYGYTPTMVAIVGALSVVAVSWLRRHTRLGPVRLWNALAETTYRMVPVAGATAAAGLVIAGMTMTGLAAKFAHVVYALTDANQFTACRGRCSRDSRPRHADARRLHSRGGADGSADDADRHRCARRPHVHPLFRGDVGDHAAGRGRGLRGRRPSRRTIRSSLPRMR
jgi:hypothetical protein